MMKGIICSDGKVTRILPPYFVEHNTDWLTAGAPKGGLLVADDTDVEVNDYISAKGKIDTLGRVKEPKIAELAANRWAAETGGAVIGGVNVDTSRESQSMLTAAYIAAMRDENYTCKWKTKDSFVVLTAAQILAIGDGIRAHVQACFDKEAELLAKVKSAKTAEAVADIQW